MSGNDNQIDNFVVTDGTVMTVGAMGDDKVVKLTMNDFWCKMLAIMSQCQCIGGWFDMYKRKKNVQRRNSYALN